MLMLRNTVGSLPRQLAPTLKTRSSPPSTPALITSTWGLFSNQGQCEKLRGIVYCFSLRVGEEGCPALSLAWQGVLRVPWQSFAVPVPSLCCFPICDAWFSPSAQSRFRVQKRLLSAFVSEVGAKESLLMFSWLPLMRLHGFFFCDSVFISSGAYKTKLSS